MNNRSDFALFTAIKLDKLFVFETILELGANPHFPVNKAGVPNPLDTCYPCLSHIVSERFNDTPKRHEKIKYLLNYGANSFLARKATRDPVIQKILKSNCAYPFWRLLQYFIDRWHPFVLSTKNNKRDRFEDFQTIISILCSNEQKNQLKKHIEAHPFTGIPKSKYSEARKKLLKLNESELTKGIHIFIKGIAKLAEVESNHLAHEIDIASRLLQFVRANTHAETQPEKELKICLSSHSELTTLSLLAPKKKEIPNYEPEAKGLHKSISHTTN